MTYRINSPCFLCHPSRLSSLYAWCTLFFPSGHRTQDGFDPSIMHTISSGTGNSVSIAEANGWINSGQWWSQSQSIVLQLEQKLLWDEHGVISGRRMAEYFLPEEFMYQRLVLVLCMMMMPSNLPWNYSIIWTYLIKSFPLVTLRVSAIPPKLTLPPNPPTLRQILHAQSWYGTGVWDSSVNWTLPHWQLPSSFLQKPKSVD